MPVHRHEFGSTVIAEVRDSDDLRKLLVDPWLKAETVIIKPNWVSTEPADFTDARTMRTFFEALDGRIVVTESHMILRSMNRYAGGRKFTAGDKEVNWQWLLKGDGWQWLTENPDWGWFKEGGHWEQIKEEEQVFLVSLDAMLLRLTEDKIFVYPPLNQRPIELADNEIGCIDREAIQEAEMKVGSWLTL